MREVETLSLTFALSLKLCFFQITSHRLIFLISELNIQMEGATSLIWMKLVPNKLNGESSEIFIQGFLNG